MKKQYEKPIIKIECFPCQDVIVCSIGGGGEDNPIVITKVGQDDA